MVLWKEPSLIHRAYQSCNPHRIARSYYFRASSMSVDEILEDNTGKDAEPERFDCFSLRCWIETMINANELNCGLRWLGYYCTLLQL